jgi:hypothetical protein
MPEDFKERRLSHPPKSARMGGWETAPPSSCLSLPANHQTEVRRLDLKFRTFFDLIIPNYL